MNQVNHGKPKKQKGDTHCRNCHHGIDFKTLPKRCLRWANTPNTIGKLKDHGYADWKCPRCGFWHLTNEPSICNQCGGPIYLESPAEGYSCPQCGANDSDE